MTHILLIRKVLSREPSTDAEGKPVTIIKTIIDEVKEASLGSVNNPNKDITEFWFIPEEK